MVAALGQGPQRIGDLMSLAGRGGKRDNPAELAGMLVGTSQAMVVARRDADTGEAATRLNNHIAMRVLRGDPSHGALASLRLGSGLRCSGDHYVTASMMHRLGADLVCGPLGRHHRTEGGGCGT